MGESEDGPARSDVLADRYRRHTYRVLHEVDDAVPVARLARQVAARTTGKPADAVSLDEHKRMYTALDRAHLPALEAAGLVERDHARDSVELSVEAVDRTNPTDPAEPTGPAGDGSESVRRLPSRPGR